MFVPPLHSHNNFETSVIGEVSIDPSSAIAPGVILQAAPNSQIIIGAGVCIGMGAILHAYDGTLCVEAGANLGSGCLIVGKSKIGTNACVGSGTTVFNCVVAANEVVPPGSIITESSGSKEAGLENGTGGKKKEARQEIKLAQGGFIQTTPTPPLTPVPTPLSPTPPLTPVPTPLPPTPSLAPVHIPLSSTPSITPVPTPALTPVPTPLLPSQAYGQGSVKQLLSTLFPHKQILNKSLNDDKSE